jgi:hypothetical protein
MFSQDDTSCTLLHIVNGDLTDVARATIHQPKSLTYHCRPIIPATFRVSLARVLPGHENLDPPHQPFGAESQMVLGQCKTWMMLWPKNHIRLEMGTPGTTPAPVPQTQSRPEAGGPSSVVPAHAIPAAQGTEQFPEFADLSPLDHHRNVDTHMADLPEKDQAAPRARSLYSIPKIRPQLTTPRILRI